MNSYLWIITQLGPSNRLHRAKTPIKKGTKSSYKHLEGIPNLCQLCLSVVSVGVHFLPCISNPYLVGFSVYL